MQTEKLNIKDVAAILEKEGLVKKVSPMATQLRADFFCYDSRKITDNTLFICKGATFKKGYLDGATDAGMICYISETLYDDVNSEYIIVNDIRKAFALVSMLYFGYEHNKPELCAFVGTKGKTTSVYMLKSILEKTNEKFAYSTTVEMNDGINTELSKLTTPESYDLHKLIASAKRNGCKQMIMEVSSMAYKVKRVYGMKFRYGAFTNISPDHIGVKEHPTFEDYLACKVGILKMCENVCINLDDPLAEKIITELSGYSKVITYSLKDSSADVFVERTEKREEGKIITVRTPQSTFNVFMHLPGDYNVLNALCAVCCAYMMGVDVKAIQEGFENVKVPGRMDKITQNGYTVISDYAHNKVSMNCALKALKEDYPDKNIIAVFGASYKVEKRREDLATEAAGFAKYVYITSDNPSFEDPYEIALQIKGFLDKYGCPCEIETDRRLAVMKAVKSMSKDDIVLITGKGREQYQIIKGENVFYEGDLECAKKALDLYKH